MPHARSDLDCHSWNELNIGSRLTCPRPSVGEEPSLIAFQQRVHVAIDEALDVAHPDRSGRAACRRQIDRRGPCRETGVGAAAHIVRRFAQ